MMLSMALAMPSWVYLASVIGAMVLGIFVLPKVRRSPPSGVGVIFLITGLLGFGLGSILSMYLALPNGPSIIATAFAGTALIFLGLSGYALTSEDRLQLHGRLPVRRHDGGRGRDDREHLPHMPALSLAVSGASSC
jgi:modulator of FtsH protease